MFLYKVSVYRNSIVCPSTVKVLAAKKEMKHLAGQVTVTIQGWAS
jgi:hypothetical protein